MTHVSELHDKAKRLRKEGFSLSEIALRLHISKSTSSLWVRGISLNERATQRLRHRREIGFENMRATRRRLLEQERRTIRKYSQNDIFNLNLSPALRRILCALLYACEGGKRTKEGVRFMNSDPNLVRSFLVLMRKGFKIDENRFRVCLHLHDYHDENKEKIYWSKITGIPVKQFIKPFHKKNSKITIKENYRGCASIRYHDSNIARRILDLAEGVLSRIR